MVPQDKPRVTFHGEDAARTVITYSMSATAAGGTFFSSIVHIEANEFEAENITFENSYGVGSQAVAISVQSDKSVFRKCRFLGWQDTVYANRGRQLYKDCYIAGHVDFIFGNATAVFDHCEIHSLGAGYLTAQSRLSADSTTGYVFYHCNLTGENTGKGVFLGRPWRPYSRVVYLDCTLGKHIRPEGWDNWRNADNEKTAFYGEYDSKGPGADSARRVPWVHSLTAEQAKAFEPETFLQGWKP
jgi:pectinesterase